jgi:hypothetical protein
MRRRERLRRSVEVANELAAAVRDAEALPGQRAMGTVKTIVRLSAFDARDREAKNEGDDLVLKQLALSRQASRASRNRCFRCDLPAARTTNRLGKAAL